MIGSLRGTLARRGADGEVIVEVGGVGYRVSVPSRTSAELGAVGGEVLLYVHTHVREDAIVLYGFAHDDERRCFEALLAAHGVGPALALSVLSALSPTALSIAVAEDDAETLCMVPGIGRRTAARLLLDLKSRLDLPGPSDGGTPVGPARAEARAALAELGYAPEEIRGALEGRREDVGVEELLRLALRDLASR
ncbi:MAG: Holliday junction branch migration protein RuvA [Acidimicrobiales bacterium]